jgi:hypothetical protein
MNIPFDTALRQKDAREAADAGILLWRENFTHFIIFFAIPFWVCAFVLRLIPADFWYLSWLILWLLKPLFDRLILHVVSIRFFENDAGYKRLFKGLGRTLTRGLLGDLLWRRFSPSRSSIMPMRVLEPRGKSAKETSKRKALLNEGGLRYCSLLTVWGIALEAALLFGEMLFLYTIADLFSLYNLYPNGEGEPFLFYAWCFNYMLIESIYVCMGFNLYINSRINVEGWDIEIIFRGLAEKIKSKKIVCISVIFCLFSLFLPASVSADDKFDAYLSKTEVPLETLQEIYSSPEFGSEKDSWGIRLKNKPEVKEPKDYNFDNIVSGIRKFFSSGLRLILIVIIAGLAVFLFFFVRRSINERKFVSKDSSMTIMRGISMLNPDELLKKSLEFFEQGNLRMAWGYCTAAAILSWSFYRNIVFPPNATENDCADIVGSAPCDPEENKAFRTLINHWISFAYAGRVPSEGSFEEAAAFCKALKVENG